MCQYTWYPTFWWIYIIIKIVLLLLFCLPIVNQYSLVIFFFCFTSEMCQYTKYPTFWWIYMYYYQNSFITCIVILNTNCDCCENCHLLSSVRVLCKTTIIFSFSGTASCIQTEKRGITQCYIWHFQTTRWKTSPSTSCLSQYFKKKMRN